MKRLKKQNGITLIILIITIAVLAILAGASITNIDIGTDIKNYNYMCADIELLESKIMTYYNNNGEIPTTGSAIVIPNSLSNKASEKDNANYYQVDLSKLYNITLNFGGGKDGQDMYIINEQSHKVYYLKGVEFKEETYHAKK